MFLSIIRDMSCCAWLHWSAALLVEADLLFVLCLLLYNIPSGRPLIFCPIRRKKDKRQCQWNEAEGGSKPNSDAVYVMLSFNHWFAPFSQCVCLWCWVFSPKAPPSCSSSERASGAVASEDARSGTGEAKRRVSAASVLELRTFHHTMRSAAHLILHSSDRVPRFGVMKQELKEAKNAKKEKRSRKRKTQKQKEVKFTHLLF